MRITGILVTNTSPPLAISAESITSCTAWRMLMINRVMSGSVRVTGPPFRICSRKMGMTEPREPSTLPKRVEANSVLPDRRLLLAAVMSRSPISLEVPITLVGLTALSELVNTTVRTLFSTAAHTTFWTP